MTRARRIVLRCAAAASMIVFAPPLLARGSEAVDAAAPSPVPDSDLDSQSSGPRRSSQPDPMQPTDCPDAVQRARIVGTPAKLTYPDAARKANVAGVALLIVSLDASGSVHAVSILHGTGNASLDGAAIAAAAQTVYAPEKRFCLGIPSRYIFRADFTGA